MTIQVSLFDVWPYLFIMACFFYLEHRFKIVGNSKKYGDYCFLLLYLFSIFRYNVGADYQSYWNFVIEQSRDSYELLSQIILNIAYQLRFPPVLFFLFSSVTLFSYRFFINKNSANPVLSWCLYFCYPMFFLQDISIIRQAGAMGMVLVAATLCLEKKYVWTLFFLSLAPLFHNSAWIGFLVLLAPLLKKAGRRDNIIIFGASFILGTIVVNVFLSLFGNLFIASKFLAYIDYGFAKNVTLQYLIYFLVLVNMFFYNRLKNKRNDNVIFMTLVTIGAALFNVFQVESQTAKRLSAFFLIFELLLIPDICDVITEKFNLKTHASKLCMLCLLLLQIYYINLYIVGYNNKVIESPCFVPYDIWWNHL